ncbi:unnamed protein product, partial [Didymodactylos carnosus]
LNSNNIVAPDDTKMIFNDTKTLLLNNNNLMKDTNEKSYIQVPSSTSSSIDTKKLMYSGSTKLYLRSLKTLLNQIEQIQKAISMRSSSVNSKLFVMSVLKQLKNLNMKQQQQHMPQTFSSLFSPPSIHCKSSNKLEPKTMSFSKILSSSEQTPTHFYTKPAVRMWTPQKRKQLIKAVQYELNEMMKKQEHQSKVNQISKKELVQESESVHYVNDIKICDIEKSLDWIHISQYHLDNQWSSIACKNAWEQICNDRINQEQWCEQEEQLLIDLVKHEQIIDDHSMGDKWSMIAQMLNTGRSAYLCAKRYMQALMKPWFENEDQINIPSDCDIRTMLNQTLSYGRKRKLIITTEHSQNKIQKLVPSSTLIFETDTANVNLTQNIKDDIDEQEQLSDSRARNVLKHVKINFANQLIDQLLNPQSSSTKHFKNIFHQTSFESCGL